jgi:hypothetical protein
MRSIVAQDYKSLFDWYDQALVQTPTYLRTDSAAVVVVIVVIVAAVVVLSGNLQNDNLMADCVISHCMWISRSSLNDWWILCGRLLVQHLSNPKYFGHHQSNRKLYRLVLSSSSRSSSSSSDDGDCNTPTNS